MEQLRLIAFRATNITLDFVIFGVAFVLGYATYSLQHFRSFEFQDLWGYDWRTLLILYLLFYGSNFFYLTYFRLYHASALRSRTETIHLYFNATSMALLLAALLAFFFPFLTTSRVMLLSAEAYAFTFLILKDRWIQHLLKRYQSNLRFQRRAVIIGSSATAMDEIRKRCTKDALLGLSIIGYIHPDKPAVSHQSDDAALPEYLGNISELGTLLDRYCIDIAVLIGSEIEQSNIESAIDVCEERGLEVWLHLDILDRVIYRAQLSNTWGISFVNFNSSPQSTFGLFIKAIFDRVASFILIILFSPLMLLVALLIKVTSVGPAIFTQQRAGTNGKAFQFYKFRSMYSNAEEKRKELLERNENTGPAFKLRDDPRITFLGQILRKTSIDELPQLFNVLMGDMSLVGPRPLPLTEVQEFSGWHRRRLSMRPGITGLWQVEGRSNIENFNNWAKLDLQYIDSWSLTYDFIILLRTIPAVLSMRGAR